jgi:hypothetical protein
LNALLKEIHDNARVSVFIEVQNPKSIKLSQIAACMECYFTVKNIHCKFVNINSARKHFNFPLLKGRSQYRRRKQQCLEWVKNDIGFQCQKMTFDDADSYLIAKYGYEKILTK